MNFNFVRYVIILIFISELLIFISELLIFIFRLFSIQPLVATETVAGRMTFECKVYPGENTQTIAPSG
ncbi:hypothetical protein MsAm2_06130 [Methanolapillus ohkumae]|uniref:Uncharacterized protein n=1 Tax=Methanolapillus ohkumae TaxID=3028298 RepID=A0AA96V670_9EURY|nr:hypothetical protein MsAm2_06130 [Methanosarcinaceae archaeon Am2]